MISVIFEIDEEMNLRIINFKQKLSFKTKTEAIVQALDLILPKLIEAERNIIDEEIKKEESEKNE